ncbi:ATP-binding cassette domain-containing protein [Rhodoferax saidenbachensis]|uniref:ABC-type bacteriocin/lantibiotic exporter with double-glycine peptidase domain n=1 Tax=Rhodoferax saidenbachensis TaxID=1484693 RepID=A0ABU1ZKF6_9BURK|nr:ATP-binding cassette domain-containing protein [Rhodoferax saidenbachensis]MDR7306030.1 ABC-type bacteriocin/lantibiotic exporter with double-glycine peptidase domain [Rhodoferax saidenbachensis]
MHFLAHNLLPRLKRLSSFFRELIGLRRTVAMLASSLALSILELGGVALLFPFIQLVTSPESSAKMSANFAKIPFLPAIHDHSSIILIAGGGLIVYFIGKAIIYSALIRYQAGVASDVNVRSTNRLIDAALNSRYQLFLDEGAVKIAGIGYSNTVHAALLFQCLIAALNEIVFLLFIFLSILLIAPWLVLGLLVAGFFLVAGVFSPTAKKVARLGHATRDLDVARHRFVYAMASAVRDIKIMGLEQAFSRRNTEIVQQHVSLFTQYQTISSALRVLVEGMMMCAVILACIWFAFSAGNLSELAPVLAIIGLVVMRSAPALARLAGNYNSFRFSLPIVEALLDMYDTVARYTQNKTEHTVIFSRDYCARNLHFSYKEKVTLCDISLDIPFGRVVAIVGPSGSGKSTLLDLLAGLQKPSSGTFTLDGKDFVPFLSADFSRRIGYVPQSIALMDATLQFNICLEENPHPVRLQDAIKKAHLEGLLQSLSHGIHTVIGEGGVGLSGGQRQRIGIARALYREPSLLILDEVTSALDEKTARAVMQELLELRGQTSILIVSHDMSVVQADHVYQIVNGKLSFFT